YPFLDALATAYNSCPPAVHNAVPVRWPHVGRLLSDAGFEIPPPGPNSQEEQQRLFRAITGFLQAIAAEMPVALLLDDLYWAERGLAKIEVPESVRSVIGQRLARLSESTQEILQDASVLGQTFGFDGLSQLGDRREEQLEAALEEAGSTGLVREAGTDTYAFDHALTQ